MECDARPVAKPKSLCGACARARSRAPETALVGAPVDNSYQTMELERTKFELQEARNRVTELKASTEMFIATSTAERESLLEEIETLKKAVSERDEQLFQLIETHKAFSKSSEVSI